jgi:hypothetical protein
VLECGHVNLDNEVVVVLRVRALLYQIKQLNIITITCMDDNDAND